MSEPEFVLLCRHAPHDNGVLRPKAKPGKSAGAAGESGATAPGYPAQDVAQVLREELLCDRPDKGSPLVRLGSLLYAPTLEATATARQLAKGLALSVDNADPTTRFFEIGTRSYEDDAGIESALVRFEEAAQLNPARPRTTTSVRHCLDRIGCELDQFRRPNAVLVVGHQPQLSWLSEYLTIGPGWQVWRRFQVWTRAPFPIDSAEVVCLRITSRPKKEAKGEGSIRPWTGHPVWSVHPDDNTRLKEIQEKVVSKLKSAELLAAIISLALTGVLTVLLNRELWGKLDDKRVEIVCLTFTQQDGVKIAIGLLLCALALYLMTVFAYDTLRMPPKFWAERLRRLPWWRRRGPRRWQSHSRWAPTWLPRRPPSSSAWVIYRNMMRTWFTLFVPATLFVLAAFGMLAVSLLELEGWWWILVIAVPAALFLWQRHFRPRLGAED